MEHSQKTMKKSEANHDTPHTGSESKWAKLPKWLQTELMVIASILTNPECFDQVHADLHPKHFFKPESEATVSVLLSHYDETGQVLTWDELTARLEKISWLRASEIEIHMRLLRTAPLFCACHADNSILWFTVERRVFRGISDAVEAIGEQEVDWEDAVRYMFETIDLPHLKDNEFLARIQAAVLNKNNCAHRFSYVPKEWEKELSSAQGCVDSVAIKVLTEIVSAHIGCRSAGGCSITLTREHPEFDGLTKDEATAALQALSRAGLLTIEVRVRSDGEEVLIPRPTAKALASLLKHDEGDSGPTEAKESDQIA